MERMTMMESALGLEFRPNPEFTGINRQACIEAGRPEPQEFIKVMPSVWDAVRESIWARMPTKDELLREALCE